MDPGDIDKRLEVPILQWSQTNQSELPPALAANPLFTRSKKSGLLESNFDCDLHKVINEVTYW